MKLICISLVLFLLTGVAGCEDEKEPKVRVLKMSVDVSRIKAKVISLPDGSKIDFPYVANTLFYLTVMQNPHFVIENPIQLGAPETNSFTGNQKLSPYKMSDVAVLKKYGFIRDKDKQKQNKSLQKTTKVVPPCIHFSPQARLAGAVVGFELTSAGGIQIGYQSGGDGRGPGSSFPIPSKMSKGGGMGGRLSFEASRLDMVLHTEDPLSNKPVVVNDGYSYETKIDGAFNYMGMVGLDFFFKTPLATTVKKAFQSALGRLVDEYKDKISSTESWNDVWESKVIFDSVIADGDTHIAFRSGWRANIKLDDTFDIYNVHYKWVGEECKSPLDYKIISPRTSIATVKVVEVGQDITIGQVVTSSKEYNITPGAIVRINELIQEKPKKKPPPKFPDLGTLGNN